MNTDATSSSAVRRASRRQEILDATRALFDETGTRDAQIDDIARSVGINRAIIYRHFTGKEELFAETLVGYLHELSEVLIAARTPDMTPDEALGALADGIIDFGLDNPAFVDCALTLLRRPGNELMDEVTQSVMHRLGVAMWSSLTSVVEVLEQGIASGDYEIDDPTLLANLFYTQALGGVSLGLLQLSVGETEPGTPRVRSVPVEQIKAYSRVQAVAAARKRS